MLKKIVITLTLIGVSFLTGYATAQSFFLNKPSSTTAANGSSQNQNVLSPSDFQNQSDQIRKQKNDALNNQLKQNLAKVPPTPAPTIPAPTAKPSDKPAETAPASSTPTSATPDSAPTPPASGDKPTSSATPAAPSEEPAGPTSTAPASSGEKQDVYTGFGSGDQNKNQSAPASGSGSGWNIKY